MAELTHAVAAADAIFALAPKILEELHEGIVIVDGTLNICYMNKQAEWMFDYHRSDVIGKHINILLPEEFRQAHTIDTAKYIKHPTQRPIAKVVQLYGLTSKGDKFPAEISLNPHKTPAGTFVVAVVHVKEVPDAVA